MRELEIDTSGVAVTRDDLAPWTRYLSEPFAERKVIVSLDLLAAMTGKVALLQQWGAKRPLLLADGRGSGPVPSEDDAEIVLLPEPSFPSLTEQVRARMRPAEQLTPEVVAAVEAYDPTGSAVWWVSPVGLNEPMLGRPVLGGRPAAQAALEDKLIVDDLVEKVGGPRPASMIVPASYDELMRATRRVIEESGRGQVVWAGDNRGGTNGGGDYVRLISSTQQARSAAEFYAERCDRVRVSEFLEGVPCSIHGIVLPDGVITLRPVELVNMLDHHNGRFLYGGLGTTWDPPAEDRSEMRELARALGRRLQHDLGFRGAFGIDGVLTRGGFRVTELNPRFSGGLTRLQRAAPDVELELVHLNALIARDVGRAAAELEADALQSLDQHRFVDLMALSSQRVMTEHTDVLVKAGDGRLELAETEDTIIGSVVAGPSAVGTFFRLVVPDEVLGFGQRAAQLGLLLHEFANRVWDTDFPVAQMAPDVRPWT